MPIYTVTFCTMDQEAGANPLWHTCILLSRLDEKTNKLEVVDNWGFYGLPSTVTDSCLRRVKIRVGLDVDISGNHGMLRHEEIRYLDLGCGLHGVTFEISEAKFLALQKKCEKMSAEQIEAINEIVKPLNLRGKTPDKTRIYPFEDLSPHIFALEMARAKNEGRESRLKPFALSLFSSANTCKAQILGLLNGILTPEQVKRVTGSHRAISRFSGKMERIYLHSSGPTREYVKKRSGDVVHYRDAEDKDVKLHWTIPPQEIECLSGEVRNLFKVSDDHCDNVKNVVRQLQRLEWLFTNAILDKKYFSHREKLINLIKEHYEVFATVEPKKSASTQKNWSDSVKWLFSQPRDEDEKNLQDNLANAKDLINSLYMAIVDGWELKELTKMAEEKKGEGQSIDNTEDEDLEALAAYLTPEKQKELCKIIDRNYLKPEYRRIG